MSEFNHTQSVASATWTVNHNLEVNETINDVFVNGTGLEKVLPITVTHTDNNTLTVILAGSQTGSVRVIG